MRTYLGLLTNAVRSALRSKHDLMLEDLALRQQLAVLTGQRARTRTKPADRLFWSWPWGANIPSAGQAALRRPVGPSRARSSEASIARLGRTKRSEDPADMTKSARTKGIAVFV